MVTLRDPFSRVTKSPQTFETLESASVTVVELSTTNPDCTSYFALNCESTWPVYGLAPTIFMFLSVTSLDFCTHQCARLRGQFTLVTPGGGGCPAPSVLAMNVAPLPSNVSWRRPVINSTFSIS